MAVPLRRRPARALLKRALVAGALMSLALEGTARAAAPPPAAAGERQAAPVGAAAADRPGLDPEMAPGEVLVRFKKEAGARARSLASVEAGALTAPTTAGDEVSRVVVPVGREEEAAARLADDDAVAYAEPNYVREAAAAPEDIGWGVRAVRAHALWARGGPTGSGVRIAIVDSGVDRQHPALAGRVAPGFDAYGGGGRDDCGHGTAVAGVAAAARSERELGVAPDAVIVPVKVLRYDTGSGRCTGLDTAIAAGIRWAASPTGGRADIINLSLGGQARSRTLARAVSDAAGAGVLVVVASGNEGNRLPTYPAAHPQVISVGGLRRSATGPQWWPRSSYGAVDVAAAASQVPVLLARGIAAQRVGEPCGKHPLCASGTSFAAPHVAGLAALLHEQHPELAGLGGADRIRRLRQWLLGTAGGVWPAGAPRRVTLRTGHGTPDALAAAAASVDPAARLLVWTGRRRAISPSRSLLAEPLTAPATAVLTDGWGRGLAGRNVAFSGGSRTTASPLTGRTDGAGRAALTIRSRRAGGKAVVTATADDRSVALETAVLQRDDNVRGVRIPAGVRRGRLDFVDDFDDVIRFPLRRGERLRATLSGVDQRTEYIDMLLFGPSATDVTDTRQMPLGEDSDRYEFAPERLVHTARRDGPHFLDIVGVGSYELRWAIHVPGAVGTLRATPQRFSPDADGVRDATDITWRLRRRGVPTLRISDSQGRVVRTRSYSSRAPGDMAFRWRGRGDGGEVLPAGRYDVRVAWRDGRGRVSSAATAVELRR